MCKYLLQTELRLALQPDVVKVCFTENEDLISSLLRIKRRRIITSFLANSGLNQMLGPPREGQLMCTLFLSMRQ